MSYENLISPNGGEKPKRTLENPQRMQLAEYTVKHFAITVEQGTKIEDVLDEGYFAHFAAQLSPYDELTVRIDDGTWFAKLLVCSCGRTWAKCVPLLYKELTTKDVDMSQADVYDGYEVKFRGPACKWSVIRKADKKVLAETMTTELDARNWLAEHVKAVK